jgi:hypothetical protein
MSWAPLTTGLLYTEANGENPTTITSGQSGESFDLAWQYLQLTSVIKAQTTEQQAGGRARRAEGRRSDAP